MKCEGCPMYDPRHYSGTGNPWCNWLGGNIASCHLTPDHQRFIDAMIRGVFYCGHCKFEKVLSCCDRSMELYPQPWFCPEYEERKEGEDG
jgi:hypothetical protein